MRRLRDLQPACVLTAAVLTALSVSHPAQATEPSAWAGHGPALFVQRWDLDSVAGPLDYHVGTNRLLTAHGGTAVLWDAATGLALEAMDIGGGALAVAFSGDGRRVLTASGGGPLRVWDVQTGEKIAEFENSASEAMSAAISPDGRRVAAGCYDHTVWVGDVDARGALRRLPDGHRGHVISARFSPDSRWLLTGAYDGQAILWDIRAGRVERIFPTPVETRWSAFRADGRRLLTLGSGTEQGHGRVIEWDIATRQPVQVIRETVQAAWFVGADVVVSADNELRLYRETEQGARNAMDPTVLAPPLPNGSGPRLSVTPGGWQVWVPGPRAKPVANDTPSEPPESPVLRSPEGEILPLSLPAEGADSMEFVDVSPDGTRLLTAYQPRLPRRDSPRLVLWDLTTPGPVHSYAGTMGRFHPDSQHALIGGGRSLQLCRITDGRPLQTYEIDRGTFESARFVAGGRHLLTASGDWYDGNQGQVLLWDVATGEVLRNYFSDDTAAYQAVMDRDQERLLATFTFGEQGGIDKLGIYHAASAELLHVISRDDHALWSFHAHPRSNRFAAGNERHTNVWDLNDSRLIRQFPGAPGPFSADGRLLTTILRRPTATLLWDVQDGRYLRFFDTEITGFHPGGATAFTQDHRASLGLLDLQTGRPIAELFTFAEDQWLAVTAEGDTAGSEEALRRVTWRVWQAEEGLQIDVDQDRTARQHRPRQVAEALTRWLPEGQSLADLLPQAAPGLPKGVERQVAPPGAPQLVVRSAEAPACIWLAAGAEGNLLLASYEDGSAALWQLGPLRLTQHFPTTGRSARIALTPDGTLAVVQGPEPAELTLWNTGTGRQQGLLNAPDKTRDAWIAAMAMHPGGRFLAVLYHGREDGSPGRTMIWDLPARRVVHQLIDPSPRRMADIAFTPDGRRLVVGYRTALKDQEEPWDRIAVWDWESETRERGIRGIGFGAMSLAFSDDGRRLLAKEGWELVVRDFPTGEMLGRWSFRHGIEAGALTGDGETIAGSTLGEGRLFRSTVAEPEQWTWTPPAEDRFPNSRYAYASELVVMEDRNLVFSPGNDGRIHIWSLDTLAPVADLFTRNGHRDWIARTSAGMFAATEGAQPQLAWEHGGRRWPLERFQQWLNRPDLVSAILGGEPAETPEVPPEVLEQTETFHIVPKETSSPHAELYAMRKRAAERLKEAGAQLRSNRDDYITVVHLERRPVDDEVLRMLPWLQSVDRLYLAATGIGDEQLRPVGLMRHVKRLSLWGNPITDAGLEELSAMWSLEVLDIHDTSVTVAGLRKLRLLPELRTLIVPADVDTKTLAHDFDRPDLQIIARAVEP